jgi:metal-dependent amidase/aminoacylase/carboxypeptidase family protein
MKNMAESIARGMGGDIEFSILKGYPLLNNDEELTMKARNFAAEYVGKENIVDLGTWMAAEDFAFYSQQVDACFYRLGVSNPSRNIVSMVHTPTFNIDESALELGSGLMAWIALKSLNS